jgi:hypothetical protein
LPNDPPEDMARFRLPDVDALDPLFEGIPHPQPGLRVLKQARDLLAESDPSVLRHRMEEVERLLHARTEEATSSRTVENEDVIVVP